MHDKASKDNDVAGTVVPKPEDERFAHCTNDVPQIPPDYSAPLDIRTSREMIRDQLRKTNATYD